MSSNTSSTMARLVASTHWDLAIGPLFLANSHPANVRAHIIAFAWRKHIGCLFAIRTVDVCAEKTALEAMLPVFAADRDDFDAASFDGRKQHIPGFEHRQHLAVKHIGVR